MIFTWKQTMGFVALCLLPTLAVQAGLPQPMCIFYGQAKDDFGWPYMDNASVVLRVGTNEYARHTITGSLTPGVNFALYVHLDDGRGDEVYTQHALHMGEGFEIVVRDNDGEKTIMEVESLPLVGTPGDVIRLNVTAGTDSDGDGLPDEWEQYLVDGSSDPSINSVEDIHPSDDFDGDGSSNINEYRAGTFAFLDYDYFFAEQVTMLPNQWMQIEFLSTPGKVYRISSRTNLASQVWSDCAYATQHEGSLLNQPLEGDGSWLSFYLKMNEISEFYNMTVE
ncbi:MAG: hypothetical protein KAU94_04800 [Verrucomicrobia bacterium]|nr:hypothetical protein [Verrucomicrobiota bacterium]